MSGADSLEHESIPRIVIAGVTSGVGKTTVALAVMHSLRRKKGLRVQPFKVGPDFIDPSYHALVTGRQSRNLDPWLMGGRRGVLECFASACRGADIAVVEGVMGLFDGMSGGSDFASTAHVAKMLDSPVVLVVDAGKAARSAAAIVYGFLCFDRKVRIAGVIFNNVAGERHAGYIADAMASRVGMPEVLGVIRRDGGSVRMEERHLGLVPAPELQKERRKAVTSAARRVSEQIDVERVLAHAGSPPRIRSRSASSFPAAAVAADDKTKAPAGKARVITRIAVALDESFNFYYADNLDALRRHGAELVFFSPVSDPALPKDVHGIILGGGFPEVLADRLEENRSMIKSIARAVEGGGMPVYGECGGLMYLTRSIRGYMGEERARKMVGLVDAETVMTKRLTLGYTEARCEGPVFGSALLRGHEFHYSALEGVGRDSRFAYSMIRGKGAAGGKDGFIIGESGLAGYMHLHFAGSGGRLAEKLVQSCARYSRR